MGSPKTFPQILEEAINSVLAECDLTDTNNGSNLRSLLEATSLQDADQHVQIQKLKDIFSIDDAKGEDLDNRASDFAGVVDPRKSATQSTGTLRVGDDRVTKKVSGTLVSPVTGGVSTTLTLAFDSGVVFGDFPSSGSVILERDSLNRQLVAYTSKTGPNILNLAAPVPSSHIAASSVILSQQGSDQAVNVNAVAYVPATANTSQINVETTVAAVMPDGELYIDVPAQTQLPGTANTFDVSRVTSWQLKPFPHATVTNVVTFTNGTDRESDDEFRARIRSTIASLARSVQTAIEIAAASVVMPSGQRVVTAQGVPPVVAGDVGVLYIDDGNGFTPTSQRVETPEIVIQNADPGQRRAQTTNWPLIDSKIRACRATAFGVQPNTGATITVGTGTLTDVTRTFGGSYIGQNLVDPSGAIFPITGAAGNVLTVSGGNPVQPIAGQNYFTYDPATPMVLNTDYVCDYTTGAIEFFGTFARGEGVVLQRAGALPLAAAYEYYTGLLQKVQKVVNGDPKDLVTYPGYKGFGVRVKVTTPQIVNIAISIGISSDSVNIDQLEGPIQQAVLTYVNTRKIGEDVIISQIIAICQEQGATDSRVLSPTGNVLALDGQLIRTTLNNISVT